MSGDVVGKPVVLCVSAETKSLMGASSSLKTAASVDVAMSAKVALVRMGIEPIPSAVVVFGALGTAALVKELREHSASIVILLQGPVESGLDSLPGVFAVLESNTAPGDLATMVVMALETPAEMTKSQVSAAKAPPQSAVVPRIAAVSQQSGTAPQMSVGFAATAAAWALVRMFGFVDSIAARRGMRLARHVQEILKVLRIEPVWPGEVACLVAEVGRISLAQGVREKLDRGQSLGPHERLAVDGVAAVTEDIVKRIPGGEQVLEVIAQMHNRFDGTGDPAITHTRERIAAGSRAFRIAYDYEILRGQALPHEEIMEKLRDDEGRYDPRMLGAVDEIETPPAPEGMGEQCVKCADLKAGMVVEEPLMATDGSVFVGEGTKLSESDVTKIVTLAKARRVRESVLVRMGT